jgi:WD40 repeat protein
MKRLMIAMIIPLLTILLLAGCGNGQPTGPAPGLVFSTATAAVTATVSASAAALQLYPTPGQVSALAWSPDGTRLATASGGSQGANFQVWDATSGKPLASYGNQLAFPCCLAWSPDGRRILSGGELATGADSNKLRIWDAATGQLLTEFVNNTGDVHMDAQAAAWSPDGEKIAVIVLLFHQPPTTAFPPEEAQIWDAATGKLLSTYQVAAAALNQPFSAIAWSPNSKELALSDGTSTVQIWDVTTSKLLLTYRGHTTPVQALAWSPDGRFLASASGYPEVQVWNPATGALVFRYQGHSAGVDALAWSPDGRRIVSGSQSAGGVGEDHPIQVWDAFTSKHPFYYTGESGGVTALAWSPNGTSIASSNGQMVQIWQAPPE